MSHSLVQQLPQKAIPVPRVCQGLGISRSGYYEALQCQARVPVECATSVHLKAAFHASYGSRRLRIALHTEGLPTGHSKVRRLMRLRGLRLSWKRKFAHTTDSKHALPVAENILNRRFEPAAVNLAWVAGITYIRTRSGWLYLAVSGCRARPVFAQGGGVGHGADHAGLAGVYGLADCDCATPAGTGADRAL